MTKILVIDKEKDVCDFTVGFFKERNFEASSAIDGNDIFQIIKRDRPDIILLELEMDPVGPMTMSNGLKRGSNGVKGRSGIEILKCIKKISRDIKVIVVTRVNDMEIINKAIKLGAIAYLTKPILLSELLDIVLKNLGKERRFFKLARFARYYTNRH